MSELLEVEEENWRLVLTFCGILDEKISIQKNRFEALISNNAFKNGAKSNLQVTHKLQIKSKTKISPSCCRNVSI
jgi:hypothetical protein